MGPKKEYPRAPYLDPGSLSHVPSEIRNDRERWTFGYRNEIFEEMLLKLESQLCFQSRYPKGTSREPQGTPREPQGNPKGAPREPQGNPKGPKGTQRVPREPEGNPKWTPLKPWKIKHLVIWGPQRIPKGTPREPQGNLKGTQGTPRAVSYTHLTLPTNREV